MHRLPHVVLLSLIGFIFPSNSGGAGAPQEPESQLDPTGLVIEAFTCANEPFRGMRPGVVGFGVSVLGCKSSEAKFEKSIVNALRVAGYDLGMEYRGDSEELKEVELEMVFEIIRINHSRGGQETGASSVYASLTVKESGLFFRKDLGGEAASINFGEDQHYLSSTIYNGGTLLVVPTDDLMESALAILREQVDVLKLAVYSQRDRRTTGELLAEAKQLREKND